MVFICQATCVLITRGEFSNRTGNVKIEIDLTSLIAGFVIGTLPFWGMASTWADYDEVQKSGAGIGGLVALKIVERCINRKNGKK